MIMKRIVLILFFYFCQHGYCYLKFPSSTLKMDSKPIATGSVTLTIPSSRRKRDTDDTVWRFSIPFTDGSVKNLNLKQTEGYLVDKNIPVWYAERANNSDKIIYTPTSLAKELGEMDFYQDYEQKAAVVVFHDQQRIYGFIGSHYFILETDDLKDDYEKGKRYLLIPNPQSPDFLTSGIPSEDGTIENWENDMTKRRVHPTIVYPQLLIQLDDAEFAEYGMEYVREMIMHWNAVDMVYSQLVKPQIKFNMAGLIIPKGNTAAPWIQILNPGEKYEYTSRDDTYSKVGKHFKQYQHIFPGDSFDMVISFTRYRLDINGTVLGKSSINVGCHEYNRRGIIIRNFLASYLIAAHEVAHFFSADHDDSKRSKCQNFVNGLMWGTAADYESQRSFEFSSCAIEAIHDYFKYKKTECLDNYPATKPDWGYVPVSVTTDAPKTPEPSEIPEIPIEVTEPVDEPLEPHCFSHFYYPQKMCQNTPATKVDSVICNRNIVCINKDNPERNLRIKAPNGTVCEWDKNDEALSVCYGEDCLEIDPESPQCVLLEENE